MKLTKDDFQIRNGTEIYREHTFIIIEFKEDDVKEQAEQLRDEILESLELKRLVEKRIRVAEKNTQTLQREKNYQLTKRDEETIKQVFEKLLSEAKENVK